VLEWQKKMDSKFTSDAGFLRIKIPGTAAVLKAKKKKIKINPQALDITETVLCTE
jgi:hypothetical protein